MDEVTKITKVIPVPTEIDLYEDGNPTLNDLLPPSVKKAYSLIPKDIRNMEDRELILAMNDFSEVSGRGKSSTRQEDRHQDIRLKHALWYEYDKAIEEDRKMQVGNITKGIMHRQYFIQHYILNRMRLEWILRPPLNYWNEQRVLLEKSTMCLHEVLDIPVVRKVCRCHYRCICNGYRVPTIERLPCCCVDTCICPPTYDSKIAQIKQKLHEMIEMRVKGAVVQKMRIDKQQLIAHVKADRLETEKVNKETSKTLPKTSKDIELELIRLRGEVKELESGKRPDILIDITSPTD